MNKSLLLYLVLFCSATLIAQNQDNNPEDQAQIDFQHYRFHEVIEHFEDYQADTPKSFQLLAKAYRHLGQFSKAEESYLNAIKLDSNNLILKNELAKLYLQMNRNKKALMLYNELNKLETDNPYYWKKIAQTLNKLQRPIEALIAYQEIMQISPSDHESALNMAKLFMDINELIIADSILKQQIELVSDKIPFQKMLLRIQYRQKEFPEVIHTAESLFEAEDSSLLTKKLAGIAYYRTGEAKKAIELLSQAAARVDNTEIIYFYLGLAHREEQNHEMATEYLEKAIDEGVSNNIGTYYTQLGANYEKMGDYKSSIQAYKIAYESSQDKILLYHLARNYDQYYKDKTMALGYYRKYISSNDTSNQLYYNYSKDRIKEIRVAKHFELDTL